MASQKVSVQEVQQLKKLLPTILTKLTPKDINIIKAMKKLAKNNPSPLQLNKKPIYYKLYRELFKNIKKYVVNELASQKILAGPLFLILTLFYINLFVMPSVESDIQSAIPSIESLEADIQSVIDGSYLYQYYN